MRNARFCACTVGIPVTRTVRAANMLVVSIFFHSTWLVGARPRGYPPAPPGPPRHLPQYESSTYPGFVPVFRAGECDADDIGVPPTRINVKKVCYSCFRIPSLARNPKTGTLYAFAEARRRDLHEYHYGLTLDASGDCPDAPDTHIAFKRSTNGGKSWSELRTLAKIPSKFQAQASPVVDASGNVIVLFTQLDDTSQWQHPLVLMINSTDDGVHWSSPQPVKPAPGQRPVYLSTNGARGHLLLNATNTSAGYRLLFPSQSGSLYSDDKGASNPKPNSYSTRLYRGSACPGLGCAVHGRACHHPLHLILILILASPDPDLYPLTPRCYMEHRPDACWYVWAQSVHGRGRHHPVHTRGFLPRQ